MGLNKLLKVGGGAAALGYGIQAARSDKDATFDMVENILDEDYDSAFDHFNDTYQNNQNFSRNINRAAIGLGALGLGMYRSGELRQIYDESDVTMDDVKDLLR